MINIKAFNSSSSRKQISPCQEFFYWWKQISSFQVFAIECLCCMELNGASSACWPLLNGASSPCWPLRCSNIVSWWISGDFRILGAKINTFVAEWSTIPFQVCTFLVQSMSWLRATVATLVCSRVAWGSNHYTWCWCTCLLDVPNSSCNTRSLHDVPNSSCNTRRIVIAWTLSN